MNIRSALMLLGVCAPFHAAAQSEPDAAIDDVVIVNGVRHPVQLRLQMLDAERNVYDLFNQFNDVPKLDIECSRGQVAGTRLSAQVCQPAFEREVLSSAGQDYLAAYRSFLDPQNMDYSPPQMAMPVRGVVLSQQRRLQRKMKELADEQPEFRDALVEYVELKIKYAQATSMAAQPATEE